MTEIKTVEKIVVDTGEAIPYYNITCSFEKLSDIFTTATNTALHDFYSFFGSYARDFNIRDELHENFFLAQVLAEVGTNLNSVRENLNYSCKSLRKTFKYYRDRPAQSIADGRCNGHPANQVSIGNKAYAHRIGNGGPDSGDGYMFRGGGFFQLTGRGNYQDVADRIEKQIGHSMTAEEYAGMITEVGAGALGAMAFWDMNEMYHCEHIDCCTAIINKQTDTYRQRKQDYQLIVKIPSWGIEGKIRENV